jgi:hypothetical protein
MKSSIEAGSDKVASMKDFADLDRKIIELGHAIVACSFGPIPVQK